MSKPLQTDLIPLPIPKEDEEGFYSRWWTRMALCTMLQSFFRNHIWYVILLQTGVMINFIVESQEAKAMAINSFHAQIMSAGIPVQDLVLKLGMKSLSGEVTWAQLRPEQWIQIVCNRDEIRVGGGGAEGPLITFGRRCVIGVPPVAFGDNYVTILLPKTCEVSYVMFIPETPLDNSPDHLQRT